MQQHLKCWLWRIYYKQNASSIVVNRFKLGREDFNDDTPAGRPSMSLIDENIKTVKKIILDNRRITIREVADDGGIWFA